jgi:hypothetical protein
MGKIIINIAVFCISIIYSYGQDVALNPVIQLSSHLFRDSSQLENINKIFPDTKRNEREEIFVDTFNTIRVNQPKLDSINKYFKIILMKNDTSDFAPLQHIYKQQMYYFKKEWLRVFKATYSNDAAYDQYMILKGFEEVLKSLWIRKQKYTLEQIFDFKLNEIEQDYRRVYGTSSTKDSVYKEMLLFSEELRTIRKGLVYKPSDFTYLDPYIERMKPIFFSYFKTINCDTSLKYDITRKNANEFCIDMRMFYSHFSDNYFKEELLNKIEKYSECIDFFYFEYINENPDDTAFARQVIHYFITSEKYKKFDYSNNFHRINYDPTWKIVMDEIMQFSKINFEEAMKIYHQTTEWVTTVGFNKIYEKAVIQRHDYREFYEKIVPDKIKINYKD